MTVSELSERMSARELMEWIAFWQIEPFGEVRSDLRAAQICQTSMAPYIKEGQKIPTINELTLFNSEKPQGQSQEEMKSLCKAFASSFRKKQ